MLLSSALMPQAEPEERERPTAVTVIGRIWLTAGILLFVVAIVDLVFWEILRPALPTLLGYASRRDPRLRFLEPLVQYYPAAKGLEAVFAAAAGVSAYHFLRLRSWARGALEAASWISLFYYSGLAYFSYRIAHRAAALDPSFAEARRHAAARLAAGIALEVVVIAGLVAMIVVLRGRKLRSAFGRAHVVGSEA